MPDWPRRRCNLSLSIQHRSGPANVSIQMTSLQMPLNSIRLSNIMDTLSLDEKFLQRGLCLLLNVRYVGRNLQGDLRGHEHGQAGARFCHRKQG